MFSFCSAYYDVKSTSKTTKALSLWKIEIELKFMYLRYLKNAHGKLYFMKKYIDFNIFTPKQIYCFKCFYSFLFI